MSVEAANRFDNRWVYAGPTLTGGGTLNSIKRLGVFAAGRSEVIALALNFYRYYWSTDRGIVHRIGITHELFDVSSSADADAIDAEQSARMARHRGQFVKNYSNRLVRLVAAAREAGARPVLVSQPLLVGSGTDPTSGRDLARIAVEFRGQTIQGVHYRGLLGLYNDATRDVALATGVPFIDLATLMPKDSALYYDRAHHNNAGAARLAEIMSVELCPILAVDFARFAILPCDDVESELEQK
jgi:hypothetical protein